MKRLVYMLLVAGALALCSFYSGSDRDGCVTYMGVKGHDFYVIDSAASRYTYCTVLMADSGFVVGREVSRGRVECTDSAVHIFRAEDEDVIVLLSRDPKQKRNECSVILEDYYVNPSRRNTERISFYGKHGDSIRIVYPSGGDSMEADGYVKRYEKRGNSKFGFSFDSFILSMEPEALQIKYHADSTALIRFDDCMSGSLPRQERNVYVSYLGKNDGKAINSLWIKYRGRRPSGNWIYYRCGPDSLGLRGRAGVGYRPFDFIRFTREKRPVLTFRDDSYIPPFHYL